MKRKTLVILSLFLVFVFAGNIWPGEADQASKAVASSDLTSSRCGSGLGLPNPAGSYCGELGYQLEAVEREDGGQRSICVFPDGSTCDVWRFFEGKCGRRYSYCAKNGYSQITKTDGKNPFSPHYAVCVDRQTKAEVGSVTDLMGLRERHEGYILPEVEPKALEPGPPEERLLAPAALPSSFDWRNHDGQDWMTSVKDQARCGSCWAFSAVGTTEAVYNIHTNFPDLDLDLSEEFLNSDCPTPDPGDCCGGYLDSALNIVRDDGIPDEDCMSYDVRYYWRDDDGDGIRNCDCFGLPSCEDTCSGLPTNCSHLLCADACADMASRLVTIDGWHSVPEDEDQIKEALVDKGPLAVCLAMSGTYDAQHVYRCTTCWDRNRNGTCDPDNGVCVIPPGQTEGTCGGVGWGCTTDADCDEDRNGDGVCDQDDCGINHCVVLVGYDDAGGYWIAKNSYGLGFGNNGCWEVGYGECHIEERVYYVEAADINFPPIADANGPYSEECQGVTIAVSLDGTGSDDPNADDTLTYSWTTNCSGGSFDDATSATPILTLNTSASAVCPLTCDVTLTVSDGEESDTDTASVTIEDATPPVLSGVPGDVTVECDSVPPPASVTATDTCDPNPTIYFSETRTDGSCLDNYTLTRTWTATDACGNSSSSVQTITVVDTTPPVLTAPPDVTIECDQSTDPSNTGQATATDNCDTTPVITYSDVETPASCLEEKTITRTWMATDACGNSSSGVQTITVVDTTPPVITLPPDVTIECDESTDPSNTGQATASDNCDTAPVITYSDVETPGSCPEEKTITRTWTATDDCGNSSSGVQTITVVDTTPPVISCNTPATITPPDAPISFTATATDNCDDGPSVVITGFDCFKFTKKGKKIDKGQSCFLDVSGDSVTIKGGVGTHIIWNVRAVDNCGNVTERQCEVEVVRQGGPPSVPPGQAKDKEKKDKKD